MSNRIYHRGGIYFPTDYGRMLTDLQAQDERITQLETKLTATKRQAEALAAEAAALREALRQIAAIEVGSVEGEYSTSEDCSSCMEMQALAKRALAQPSQATERVRALENEHVLAVALRDNFLAFVQAFGDGATDEHRRLMVENADLYERWCKAIDALVAVPEPPPGPESDG